jgi:hypothetical protein
VRFRSGLWYPPGVVDTGSSGNHIQATLGPGDVLHISDANKAMIGLRYVRVCP